LDHSSGYSEPTPYVLVLQREAPARPTEAGIAQLSGATTVASKQPHPRPKRGMQMVEEILEGVARSYPSKLIDDQL
jgi:hypothetical protein